jgi:hypothetical protein
MTLPTDRDARNALPVWDGVISYFPDVWAEIAKVSVLGNKQHNLGAEKLYFNREVSTDHLNKVMRHCLDHEAGIVFDDEGQTRHLAKAAWRILAALQVSIENERKADLASIRGVNIARSWQHHVSCPKKVSFRAECDCGEPPGGLFSHAKGKEPT